MDEHFSKDWQDACDHFKVMEYRVWGVPSMINRYLHAEADTGSKYEVLSTEMMAEWRNSTSPTYYVTVANPWERVWTSSFGSIIYPDYALEHWRSPHRTVSQMHGGDAAALTICLNMICGHGEEQAVSFAKSFYMGSV